MSDTNTQPDIVELEGFQRTQQMERLSAAATEFKAALAEIGETVGHLALEATTQTTLDYLGDVSDIVDPVIDGAIAAVANLNSQIATIDTNITVPAAVEEPEEVTGTDQSDQAEAEQPIQEQVEVQLSEDEIYEGHMLNAIAKIAVRDGVKAGQEFEVKIGAIVAVMYGGRMPPDQFQNLYDWLWRWDRVRRLEDNAIFVQAPEQVTELELVEEEANRELTKLVEIEIRKQAQYLNLSVGDLIEMKLGRLVHGIYGDENLAEDDFRAFMTRLNKLAIVVRREGSLYTFEVPPEPKPDEDLEPMEPEVLNTFLEYYATRSGKFGQTERLHVNQIAKAIFGNNYTQGHLKQISSKLLTMPGVTKISKAMFDIDLPEQKAAEPERPARPAQTATVGEQAFELKSDPNKPKEYDESLFDDVFVNAIYDFARDGKDIKMYKARVECDAIKTLSDKEYGKFKLSFAAIRQEILERLAANGTQAYWETGGFQKGAWYRLVIEQ